MGVEAFWGMTPRETWMALEAAAWRMERENERVEALVSLGYKALGWLAWHTAALQRAKRMPGLKELIGGGGTKTLTREEAAERKREFEELKKVAESQFSAGGQPLHPRWGTAEGLLRSPRSRPLSRMDEGNGKDEAAEAMKMAEGGSR